MKRREFFSTVIGSIAAQFTLRRNTAFAEEAATIGHVSERIPEYIVIEPSPNESAQPTSQAHKILLVGDTQRTSWMETTFLGREQNDRERVMILNAMAQEAATEYRSAVLLLGDHVCYGEELKDWEYFDNIMQPLRAATKTARTPIYAIPGNHDYGLLKKNTAYLAQMFKRFPDEKPQFPSLQKFGATALVMLDSNIDQLTKRQIDAQYRQFKRILEQCDHDPTITSVLVAAHHPPYTNSTMQASLELHDYFTAPFLAARKTSLFFSGHVHSYERFGVETGCGQKMFVISGGGGGPRRSVRTDAKRPQTNDLYRTGTIRSFHYIRLTATPSNLAAEVMMLTNSGTFIIGDRFVVPLPL